jgi:hypothetical protein
MSPFKDVEGAVPTQTISMFPFVEIFKNGCSLDVFGRLKECANGTLRSYAGLKSIGRFAIVTRVLPPEIRPLRVTKLSLRYTVARFSAF